MNETIQSLWAHVDLPKVVCIHEASMDYSTHCQTSLAQLQNSLVKAEFVLARNCLFVVCQ